MQTRHPAQSRVRIDFTDVTAKPEKASQEGIASHEAVQEKALEKLAGTSRAADYVGHTGKNKMLVLLPVA